MQMQNDLNKMVKKPSQSCFFFSSRRRHTRSYGDWSSDVCSSDLYFRTGRSRTACPRLSRSLLPVLKYPRPPRCPRSRSGRSVLDCTATLPTSAGTSPATDPDRSEERRVGKERRLPRPPEP